MQLGVFAAPRNEGIWDEVRAEIARVARRSSAASRPSARAARSAPSCAATLPAQGGTRMPVRFIGVDGPRWFLRAMLVGAAADPGAGRACSRRRSARSSWSAATSPLPVREPVPLTLPKDARAAGGEAADADDPSQRSDAITATRPRDAVTLESWVRACRCGTA